MIEAGGTAPDFTAPTSTGASLTLSSLRGRPLVLYFFPKANSMGCTMETRAFAEHFDELASAGWGLVGVSVDAVPEQQKFAAKCKTPFPLVSDVDKAIARAYGVLGFLGFARRVTFLIGPDGRVLEVVSSVTPGPHVDRALERARSGPAK